MLGTVRGWEVAAQPWVTVLKTGGVSSASEGARTSHRIWRSALGHAHSSQNDWEDQSLGGEKIAQPGRNKVVIYGTHIAPVNFLRYTVF